MYTSFNNRLHAILIVLITLPFCSIAQEVELKTLEAVLIQNQALLKRYMMELDAYTAEYRYYTTIIDLDDEGGYIYLFEDKSATFTRKYDERLFKHWIKSLRKEYKYAKGYDSIKQTEWHSYIINYRNVVFYKISNPVDPYLMISYEYLD